MSNEQRYYDALKRITKYQTPEQIMRRAEKQYGLSGTEALEMAYENIQQEARNAIVSIKTEGETIKQQPQPAPVPPLVEAVSDAIGTATRYHGFTYIIENKEFEAMHLALAAEKRRQELVDKVIEDARRIVDKFNWDIDDVNNLCKSLDAFDDQGRRDNDKERGV